MTTRIAAFALIVRDYDEAIAWYRGALDFELLEDTDMGGGKRWVRMQPRGGGSAVLLARAVNDRQSATVGNQGGGRVWLFLHTDDFAGDFARMTAFGVHFTEQPRHEAYGTVVVFEDLYGNRWDLIEPK
jgi:catechol 2,3-dioxygenase-like lactoylglutathione lyase family enzyme